MTTLSPPHQVTTCPAAHHTTKAYQPHHTHHTRNTQDNTLEDFVPAHLHCRPKTTAPRHHSLQLVRPRVCPNSRHVFRLDTPVLPGLRQANRRRHLLLRVLPPGRLRQDLAVDSQLRRELPVTEQPSARLEPLQADNISEHQVLPLPGLRLRSRPAKHPEALGLQPHPLAVCLADQPLLHAEHLVCGPRPGAADREGGKGAPSIRPLFRIRPRPTPAIILGRQCHRARLLVFSSPFPSTSPLSTTHLTSIDSHICSLQRETLHDSVFLISPLSFRSFGLRSCCNKKEFAYIGAQHHKKVFGSARS